MRIRFSLLAIAGLSLACTGTSTPVDSADTGDSVPADSLPGDTAPVGTEHCGELAQDEIWTAEGSPHLVTCTVELTQGTLVVEAGSELRFADGTSLLVAQGDFEATLSMTGTEAAPIRLVSETGVEDEPSWQGISLGSLAVDSSLSWVEIRGAGSTAKGVVMVDDSLLSAQHLDILGANKAGIYLKDSGAFTEDSAALSISSTAEPVSIDASQAASVPAGGSDYSGNAQDTITLRGTELGTSAEWEDLGVPYLVEEVLAVSGTAEAPAVLTLGAGTELLFAKNAGLNLSKDGGASGLITQGSGEAPVVLGPLGSAEPGYWKGLGLYEGIEQAELTHTQISSGGGGTSKGALLVDSCTAYLSNVELLDSEDAGLAIRGSGRLDEASDALTLRGNDVAISAWAGAVGDLPKADSSYTGNTRDVLVVEQSGELHHSATWSDLELVVELDESLQIEGSSESPSVLTLEAGLQLRVANDKGIFVSKSGGAAGLIAQGSADEPVVFEPRDSNVQGAWAGIGLYDDAEDASCVLEHVQIRGGGGKLLSGNVHIDGVDATLSSVDVSDSLEWGVWVTGDALPSIEDLSGEDNVLGLLGPEE